MRERHEEYMKRRIREEEQMNEDLAHDRTYIYESPDKGKTVYARESGNSKERVLVKSSPEEQKIYDYLDVKIPYDSITKYDNKPSKEFSSIVSSLYTNNKSKLNINLHNNKSKSIEYKYNEDALLKEFKSYIDATYGEHYSKDKFQATEFIMDGGHGTGFCIGNVLKYAQRYGKKGTREDARKDLMKVLHYALMQLYVHDRDL